ncbi:MAG: S1C family serine protease [Dermatophilaceae bacterium]|nr:trypsin-like peptidase domain-containing protein [Intrasporangiaceae bacterium]
MIRRPDDVPPAQTDVPSAEVHGDATIPGASTEASVTPPAADPAHTEPLAPVWSYEPQHPAYPGPAQHDPAAPAYQTQSSQPGNGHAFGTPPPPRERRGPGWGAMLTTATLAAVLAGGVGGVAGGWLASNDYLDFGTTGYTAPAPEPGAGATDRPQGSIANISARALPSVVTILVDGQAGQGSGSGWAFDNQGHIVTNNHVIESAADGGTVVVQTADGQRHDATIVGRDESYDLAVLKVSDVKLEPLPLGISTDVRVGDGVIAMGAPLGLDSTVTAGIISALNRPVSPGGGSSQSFINAIQTDAAINPGNSGGPLLNMDGQVIGVNSAIATMPSVGASGGSGNIGVGFAIPSDQVSKTVEQLIRTGKAEHPIIGVILDRQHQGEGVKILIEGEADQPSITPDGPADRAGLQAGDVILEFEGRPITNPDELVVAIRAKNVGDEVRLTVQRGSATLDVTMTLQGRTLDP